MNVTSERFEEEYPIMRYIFKNCNAFIRIWSKQVSSIRGIKDDDWELVENGIRFDEKEKCKLTFVIAHERERESILDDWTPGRNELTFREIDHSNGMVVLVLVERVRFHDYYAERRVQISSLDTSMTNRGGNSCMETKTNLGCNFLGRGGTTRITAIETWALRRYIWSMADNSLSLSLSLWWKQFSNYPPRLSTKFFEFDFIRGSPSLERSIKCDNFNRIIIISRRIRKSEF